MHDESSRILALDVEYNSLTGVVYQIGAVKFGVDEEIHVFNGITSSLLRECCSKKVEERFFNASENALIGYYPMLLQAFIEFSEDVDLIMTWGRDDGIVLAREAERCCLDIEKLKFSSIIGKLVNLQAIFTKSKKKNGNSLKDAVATFGMEFKGTPHNAVSDALNTLLLASRLNIKPADVLCSLYGIFTLDYFRVPIDAAWNYNREDTSSIRSFCSRNLLQAFGIA